MTYVFAKYYDYDVWVLEIADDSNTVMDAIDLTPDVDLLSAIQKLVDEYPGEYLVLDPRTQIASDAFTAEDVLDEIKSLEEDEK